MKKATKLLSLLLVLCMTIAMMTACGAPANDDVSVPTITGEDDMSETITYKLVTHSGPTQGDWNEYTYIKAIEEKFNVDIQVEQISNDVWDERLAVMLASDELPDFFLNSLGASDIATYGAQGYFIPLEGMISETETPNLYKMFETYPALRGACTELDGHIYAIAGVSNNERELAQNRFYVHTPWAEEILGKMPENLDEFYQYLVGVRDKDMDGDGDATNEIPLGGWYTECPTTINIMLPILSAFGYTSQTIEAMDGKVVYVPAEENYKEFLRYMNKLYTEKLLDAEYFTQGNDQFNAKNAQHLYGAYCYYASFVNQPEEEWYTLDDGITPMTSQYNDTPIWPANDISLAGKFIITKNAKNPERLMKILDWIVSQEGRDTWGGWEYGANEDWPNTGIKYEEMEDGTWRMDWFTNDERNAAPEGYDSYFSFRQAVISPDWGYFPEMQTRESYVDPATGEGWLTHNIMDNYAEYYHNGFPTTVKYTDAENNELALLSTDIDSWKTEMETKMITGELDIDATWESYIEGLNARGLEQYLKIHQDAYDRWANA